MADIPKSAGLAFGNNGDIYVSSVGQTDYWYFAKDSLDGVILGRILTQNEDIVRIILVGNIIKDIPSSEIKTSERLTKSLMWPGLLTGMSEENQNALLDYLASL